MKLIVNPHKIELIQEEAVNEKEIDISKCEFEFDEEITEDYVKEAYFTLGDKTYKQVITNNQCSFPQEVLVKPATIELGVVAYLVEDEVEIKRYNPTPVYFKTDLGSLKNAENSQPITPSEMEQYEQALQDGLEEVNSKLGDIDEAILETSNLNITATKTNNVTYVSVTNKEGTTNTVEILDGEPGTPGAPGQDGTTPTIGDNGNWYIGSTDTGKPSRGATGQTGQTGATGPAGRDGVDGISPTATVTKSGSTATITVTDKNGTTTTTVSDGTNGTNGTNGRDGYVQYTAGANITIEDNVISATGGGDASDILVLKVDDNSNEAKAKAGKMITEHYGKGLIAIMQGQNPIPIYNAINTQTTSYDFNQTLHALKYSTSLSDRSWFTVTVSGTWTDNVFTCTSLLYYQKRTLSQGAYVLPVNNTASYTPENDYNPATKKYVDDAITTAITTTLGGSF